MRRLLAGGFLTAIITFIMIWKFTIITHHFELLILDLKFSMRYYMEKEPEMSSDLVLVALDDESKINSG